VRWISRVPATCRDATALLSEDPASWQLSADRQTRWFSRHVELAQGRERWLVGVTDAGLARTRSPLAKRAQRDREHWERQLWHLGNQAFACQADAQAEQQRQLKTLPVWLQVACTVSSRPHYAGRGRPPKGRSPDRQTWQVQAQVTVDDELLEREVQHQARFLLATNVLDPAELPDEQLIGQDKAQSGGERGFAFLKDPLFLASSVFLKRPERIMALACWSTASPSGASVSSWRRATRPCRTSSSSPPTVPPCAGCSSALRASVC
jgi:transposase